ncbi:TetR/AcrR family transcriptional regulator [Pseudochrobactrum kiredjianiae]|uniref:TetR/AcrR family transcriptional regulator n=1 Tax=Pseudochrobactrum kiredjianiae TaxID=386305 RepID=A0ABW3V547_9HYPH|nr:TetR/AcrR family transcriptional regulator [Pseudochrobactrum kiredjianiae]MDM7849611.1 TetR/AcrR family transcriptional regulator [Pseudochrobactrum kiredjianiae]
MALRGRPRSFDREVALDSVMKVFWEKGYECAQINDFTAAIGITPPSFYAAFGSKEQAFREAVDYYTATIGGAPLVALDQAVTIQQGIRAMLETHADKTYACPAGGCMVSVSSIQCKPENKQVKEFLKTIRQDSFDRIYARCERAIKDGDLPEGTDLTQMAEFYHAMLQSLSYEARDGGSREAVQSIIEMAMRAMPKRVTVAA